MHNFHKMKTCLRFPIRLNGDPEADDDPGASGDPDVARISPGTVVGIAVGDIAKKQVAFVLAAVVGRGKCYRYKSYLV